MTIINLTQHFATESQKEAGVQNMSSQEALKDILTFNSAPTMAEMQERASLILDLIDEEYGREVPREAMLGGAPFFMPTLDKVIREAGITPVYAFSVRRSVESTAPDGSVAKCNVFYHEGFVGEN